MPGIEGLTNPRGFILIDEHQRNPKYRKFLRRGVCVAIPPVEETPVPTGAPKTGYMIESMVEATAANIAPMHRRAAEARATWNAMCLRRLRRHRHRLRGPAAASPAQRQLVPGKLGAPGQVAFEKYFLYKVRAGTTEPYYERAVMKLLDIGKIKRPAA